MHLPKNCNYFNPSWLFRKFNNLSLLLLILIFSFENSLAQTFEFNGKTSESWDFLDWRGDAKIYPTNDYTSPPGFGPEVLHIEGSVVLGMVKGMQMSEGTFVALYRENEPRNNDADGIIMVKSEYGSDISVAHNTKEELPHVWFEQDNDCGIQLRSLTKEGVEEILAERCGDAVVTDPWNKTNWIWQKVNIKGNVLRAKTWPAHKGEPVEWALKCEYNGVGERFGFRINSGDISLAYFAADTKDISIEAPKAFLHAPTMQITQTKKILFSLFTNQNSATVENLRIKVVNNDKSIGESVISLEIPKGSYEIPLVLSTEPGKISESNHGVLLTDQPKEGLLHVMILDKNDNVFAERTVTILPVQRMLERFDERRKTLRLLSISLRNGEKESRAYKEVKVIYDAATAHLDNSLALFDNGDLDASDMAFRFVDEALGELTGYKRKYAAELNFDVVNTIKPWDKNDRRGVGPAPEHGVLDAYSMQHLLSFGDPIISAQSMVMGSTYDLTIPWKVEGDAPAKDYNFEIRLVSPLGTRVVASTVTGPDIQTSKWKPGETNLQHITLAVSPEDPKLGKKKLSQPVVLDEYHNLLISVIDPETGGKLILGNAPGAQPERVGQSFFAGEIFISSTPLEIKKFSPSDGVTGKMRTESFDISNVGNKKNDVGVLLNVSTESGRIVYQDFKSINTKPGETIPIKFNWKPEWAGNLAIKVQLVKDGKMLTEAKREVNFNLPNGVKIIVQKENHVKKLDGKYVTPVLVKSGSENAEVSVFANDRLLGSAKGSNTINVNVEPWFGYYDIVVKIGKFNYSERIIATVVEVDGMDIKVNGEPFLIKGVNVHGLDGRSPERSASMMRIMRELGFNAWRGDYPPLWQMELAYELNSIYTVLAPFSCVGTDGIFARQAGPPMTTARELSRLIVERYKNSAGVLLWNSSNEVYGEKEDFISTLLPVYKVHDPYNRPVHYSNLFGQDLHQGQDAMGINYYFSSNQSAEDKQPIIQRSIDIARNNNIPVMYTEFNSYAGAVHSTGVEAMYGLYDWGIEQGMCGGFQYMKGNSTSHPGVFDGGYNTHKIYNEAIIDVLADAKVTLKNINVEEGKVTIIVKNKRQFSLRQISLSLTASGEKIEKLLLPDITPRSAHVVTVELPKDINGKAVTIKGYIEFVTHYGFNSKVPVSLVALN